MRLTEQLRDWAMFSNQSPITPLLLEAATRLEDQRLWREAWLNAEEKVELLTSELNQVRLRFQTRKEKDDESSSSL